MIPADGAEAAQRFAMPAPRWLDALLGVSSNRFAGRSDLRTVIAHRPEQLHAAAALVRRRYAWRGYRFASALPAGMTLLAQHQEMLVATLTVRPGAQALLAESTYADEIRRLRAAGRRVGELVALAIEQGADWRSALDALVRSAYLVGTLLHALTDVVIEVNPRHAGFYRRVFGFTVAAAERLCARVGAPSVLLVLDAQRFGSQINALRV